MTRLLFVHGAGEGSYEEDRALAEFVQSTQKDQVVFSYPRIEGLETFNWSAIKMALSDALSDLEDGGTVVAHSAGAAAVLKILTLHPELAMIGDLHLVAAPYTVVDGDCGEGELALDLDFADKLPEIGTISLYHSRDDETVPFEHLKLYSEKLPQAGVIELEGYGHQFSSEPFTELSDELTGLRGGRQN